MNAAIVAIGDEILIGQVIDTNSVWISGELTSRGVYVAEMVSISDNPKHIITTLERLIGKVDLILITGGLGPTKDDITKETLTDFFGGKLVVNHDVLEVIEQFFKNRGRVMIDSNRRQALVPDNCKIVQNNHGTAPGMWFSKENTQIISMPGVPYEMKPMLTEQVFPDLADYMKMPALINKTIMTQGVPESYLAEMIKEWEESLPKEMKLAYLPRPGIVRLRLTVNGKPAITAEELLKEKISTLSGLIGDHIFGFDDIPLESVVGSQLNNHGFSISTAESCTGGNIARLITSVSGSSAYYKGSVIAYCNEMKESLLGVEKELIERYGAVSREVVEKMAAGVMRTTGTDVAIATSGIAGPSGGSETKPVGTVWIAVGIRDRIVSKEFRFGGHRELVIEQSSIAGLGIARRLLSGLTVE